MLTRRLLTCIVVFSWQAACIAAPPTEKTVAEQEAASVRLDRYGDALPPGAVARLGTMRWRANGTISCVTFSPDGKRFATGKQRNVSAGPQDAVTAVHFSPDSRLVATGSNDGTVRLWDARLAEQRRCLPGKEPVNLVSFSADGKTLISEHGLETFWDVSTGKEIPQRNFAAPERTRIEWEEEEEVSFHLVDAASGKRRHRFVAPDKRESITTVALSPDATRLAFASQAPTRCREPNRGSLMLCDARTGKTIYRRIYPASDFDTLAFSPDSKVLALTNRRRILLCRSATGEQIAWLQAPHRITSVSFSSNSKSLTSCGIFWNDTSAVVWEVATGQERARFDGASSEKIPCALSPDGRTLATGCADGTTLLWDLTGQWRHGSSKPRPLSRRDLEARWTDLAGSDAGRAYQSLWDLALHAEQAVPFLKERLRPAVMPDPRRIVRLLADLDSDQFAVREAASAELEKCGEGVIPNLQQTLKDRPSLEMRRRIENLLAKLQPAIPSAERLRELRAVEALEYTATPQARQLLEMLAQGAACARLTREAKQSLDRLTSSPSRKREFGP